MELIQVFQQLFPPVLPIGEGDGLEHHSFFGRRMQPAQDWLPIAIPQIYLMLSSE